ncbi:hypothetical protein AKJ37_06340, partial [candidate division MSBL1 archaeon SCGC-AAA259I09]
RGREGGARTEHLVEVELRSTGRGGKVEPPYLGLEAKQIKLGYTKNSTSQSSPFIPKNLLSTIPNLEREVIFFDKDFKRAGK